MNTLDFYNYGKSNPFIAYPNAIVIDGYKEPIVFSGNINATFFQKFAIAKNSNIGDDVDILKIKKGTTSFFFNYPEIDNSDNPFDTLYLSFFVSCRNSDNVILKEVPDDVTIAKTFDFRHNAYKIDVEVHKDLIFQSRRSKIYSFGVCESIQGGSGYLYFNHSTDLNLPYEIIRN